MFLPTDKKEFDALVLKVQSWQNSFEALSYPHNSWQDLKDFAYLTKNDLMPFDGLWSDKDFSDPFVDVEKYNEAESLVALNEEENNTKYHELKTYIYFSLESYLTHLARQRSRLFDSNN